MTWISQATVPRAQVRLAHSQSAAQLIFPYSLRDDGRRFLAVSALTTPHEVNPSLAPNLTTIREHQITKRKAATFGGHGIADAWTIPYPDDSLHWSILEDAGSRPLVKRAMENLLRHEH